MADNAILKTDDKSLALSLLECCLESEEVVNAEIQKLDGLYSVEVSKPTDEAVVNEPHAVAG